ncbi:MAG: DUF3800 domain-containing protein [Nitrospirae bacterium]|nr:DUF3800 domain-containing protein [Nitrospirota bacterium]
MLFFIDESWQSTLDNQYKVGVLSAIQINSCDFNECSQKIFKLKSTYLGFNSGEINGKELFKNYLFNLELKGIKSKGLDLARDIFDYMETLGTRYFASIVFSKREIDLACEDANQLERPYFFLFERIDLFMKENYPNLMAKPIFDDRGVQHNVKTSKSVSNFFHKCKAGQRFDTIIKVPFFAISSEAVYDARGYKEDPTRRAARGDRPPPTPCWLQDRQYAADTQTIHP